VSVVEERWGITEIGRGSMNDLTLAVDCNVVPTTGGPALKRFLKNMPRPKTFRAVNWQTLEQITFGLFMGGLVVLLVLLYSDILIV
jgi:hypothetical protein